ncbi:hypothetical protein [Streptomyces sp. B21-101]|uniref:hypothetical protein n=1 Tax=Streptomyces sp. B21-101 TaxID=3039415 RepID=UPI002FEE97DD
MKTLDQATALTEAAMRHAHSRPSDQERRAKLDELLGGLPPEQLLQVASNAIWQLGSRLWATELNASLNLPQTTATEGN